MNGSTVLVVENDPTLRATLCDALQQAGYPVQSAAGAREALLLLDRGRVGMVVGEEHPECNPLLDRIRSAHPDLPVLMMAAGARGRGRAGAAGETGAPSPEVIAEDLRSRELLEMARRVAQSEATVMLGGESGTGKEVFAHFIHRQSPRRNGPFIAINCAAIPENMLESMLFGHEKGAFTGAHQAMPGKFELAAGGTLLLDEISEMTPGLQAKLLRVLQEREVERLGGHRLIRLNVRVLATSNRNLREEVAAGRFREDLYYRLNVFPLFLPPLRERQRDILPLAGHLLQRCCSRQGIPTPELTGAARRRLLEHRWPGNVRELENVMQRALILCDGYRIDSGEICFESENELAAPAPAAPRAGLNDDLRSVEERMILDALREGNGSRKYAAERLGISPRTLRYKIARLRECGIEIPG
ncbi:MAG TPA: sigma-54-dependent Fis family transcriptional regulator [Sedimenticola sp.]|nr:sigma-54-dependent Fis family transcriptional regulator [Sedimenticola sp.]